MKTNFCKKTILSIVLISLTFIGLNAQELEENRKDFIYKNFDNFFAISSFSDSNTIVMKDKKWGLIDENNKLTLPLKFDGLYKMNDEFLVFIKNGKYGVIDYFGKEIIPAEFDYLYDFMHDKMIAVKGDKYGIIDRNGKTVMEFDKQLIMNDVQGYSIVDFNKNTVQNLNPNLGKLEIRYYYMQKLDNGYSMVQRKNSSQKIESAILDPSGKVAFDFISGTIIPLSESKHNLSIINNENQKGVFSLSKLAYIIPLGNYDRIDVGKTSIITVNNDNESTSQFYGLDGKLLSNNKYEDASPFESNNTAIVTQHGKNFFINTKFERIGPENILYEESSDYNIMNNGNITAKEIGKGYGMMDANGKILLPFNYEKLYFGGADYQPVKELGTRLEGIIDRNGVWKVLPGVYADIDIISYSKNSKNEKLRESFRYIEVTKPNTENEVGLLDLVTFKLKFPFQKYAKYDDLAQGGFIVNFLGNQKWLKSNLYPTTDLSKKIVLPDGLLRTYYHSWNLVQIKMENDKSALYDLEGNRKTELYDQISLSPNSNNELGINDNGKLYFINKDLKITQTKFNAPPPLIGCDVFFNRYTGFVYDGDKPVVINRNLDIVGSLSDLGIYDNTNVFLASVDINKEFHTLTTRVSDDIILKVGEKNYKYKMGKEYNTSPKFNDSSGKIVERNGKYGVLDSYGKEIIECKYDGIIALAYGLYFVRSSQYNYVFNKAGEKLSFKVPMDLYTLNK